MKLRGGLAVLLLAGGLVIGTGTIPAFADGPPNGPPVPPGCSFDQATGVETCVTTTTTTTAYGPVTTNGYVPTSTTFGGITGQQICSGGGYTSVDLTNVVIDETITTTTTTERHGLNGRVFNTLTSTSASLRGLQPGTPGGTGIVSCHL